MNLFRSLNCILHCTRLLLVVLLHLLGNNCKAPSNESTQKTCFHLSKRLEASFFSEMVTVSFSFSLFALTRQNQFRNTVIC